MQYCKKHQLMEQRRTLVLLGVNTKQEFTEEEVIGLVSRLSGVMEKSISNISDNVFIMFDKSISDEVSDIVMNNMPRLENVSPLFVANNNRDSGIVARRDAHFKEKPNSLLVIISDIETRETLEAVMSAVEAVRHTPLHSIITLP